MLGALIGGADGASLSAAQGMAGTVMRGASALIEFPRVFKQTAPSETRRMAANARRLGYVDGAIGDADLVARLAALFPDVVFESVGAAWADSWPRGY